MDYGLCSIFFTNENMCRCRESTAVIMLKAAYWSAMTMATVGNGEDGQVERIKDQVERKT